MKWNAPKELQERSNPLASFNHRPNVVDLSEQWVVKDSLAIGLYEGTFPGLKLASAMAFPVVSVPVSFMGLPTPIARNKDQKTQDALNSILKKASTFLQKIFILRRVVGTAWAFPNWDSETGSIYHELIPNSSVSDIIRNLTNGKVLQIITTEQLTIQSGENRQSVVTKKRYFTPQTIRTEYTGDTPQGLIANSTVRNTAGIMPVAFANDVIDNSKRGKSVYTRLLSHLKNLHDLIVKWSQTLSKFNVKWVQTVEGDFDKWLANNPGLGVPGSPLIDVNEVDFIINKNEVEDTKFIFPGEAVANSFEKLVEVIQNMIIFGSGVPEMAFGGVATGNHASAEEQMTTLANTVLSDQSEINDPLHEYVSACLRLESGATMQNLDPEFDLTWNDLEVVSMDVAAGIQQKLADAMQKLTANASITLEQQHQLLLKYYPKATEPDFTKWRTSLDAAAKYKQFQTASFLDAIDVQGVAQ